MDRITVVGNGVLSLSIAADAAKEGAEVTYVDVCGKCKEKDFTVTVCENGGTSQAKLKEYASDFISIADADVVVVAVTASHYDRVFENMRPYIKQNQLMVFFPASFGALYFKHEFRGLNITICESVSFPMVCEFDGQGRINVQNRKNCLKAAVSPHEMIDEVLARLNKYFKILEPAQNFMETSMDNMNMTLHPLPVLLNVSNVDKRADEFRHYVDGVSPSVGKLMERLDTERMAIGAAYGLKLTSAIQQLKNYYGDNGALGIAEYVSAPNGPYPDVKGYGLYSRYISEDIPNLLVPTISFASVVGVNTPIMNLCVLLASSLNDADYSRQGLTLEKLGLAGCEDKELILKAIAS